MKRYLAPINTITRSGNIVVGTQEHLLEDETKTAEYIREHCDTYYDYHDNYFTDLNNAPYYHCIEK